MDDERFDRLTHLFATGLHRRGLAGVAAVVLGGLSAAEGGVAKKKKKKKKKVTPTSPPPPAPPPPPPPPPGPTCKAIQKACSFSAQDCCDGARRGYNPPCQFQDVCFQEEGGPCADQCDCRGVQGCDERNGNVCSATCKFPQGTCGEDNDCCLNASTCGKNVCGTSGVCCQAAGATCGDNCDCCEPNFCNERTATCGNCAGMAGACQGNDDCCTRTAVCGTDSFGRPNHCCQPAGAACAFTEMCCTGLVCNPFQQKCVAG